MPVTFEAFGRQAAVDHHNRRSRAFQRRQVGWPQFSFQQYHKVGTDALNSTVHNPRSVKGKKGGLRPDDAGVRRDFCLGLINNAFTLKGIGRQKNRYFTIGTQSFHQIYRQEGFTDRGRLDPDICRFRPGGQKEALIESVRQSPIMFEKR